MSLRDQIIADLTVAMKAKDAARTSTLRMLKAAIVNRQIEKGGELDEEELLKLLRTQAKQRRDSVEQYEKGGRQDLVDPRTLRYGQSITDACMGWELTVPTIVELANAVRARRR